MPDLADRVTRVRLLLETLNDYIPTPQGALRSDSGPAASRYVPCETCRGSGHLKQRSRLVLCLGCDGFGWRRREPGDVEWDAYVGLPVEQAAALPSMPNGRRASDVVEDAYSWERARRAAERHGSYKEVRIRLDQLGQRRPDRHRLVRAVLVDKEPRLLSEVDEMSMNLGVVEITIRMRSIRVPPWIIERSAAADRRESVSALHADGYSASEIARRTGLSRTSVRRRIRSMSAVHSGQAGTAAARV